MFCHRKLYASPSSHGLPVMQRSNQINAQHDINVIYIDTALSQYSDYSNITWASWSLKLPTCRWFV